MAQSPINGATHPVSEHQEEGLHPTMGRQWLKFKGIM